MRRARARPEADLVLWVVDAAERRSRSAGEPKGAGPPIWLVRNKIDLLTPRPSRN